MNHESVPESFEVPLQAMVSLAVEQWRLSGAIAQLPASVGALARHSLRKMDDFLKLHDLEARSMEGEPFDPGLAARVVDSAHDSRLPPGTAMIDRTLSPLVLWRGQVVREAEVCVRRGIKK